MKSDIDEQTPMIFLGGPPGAGKSSLGEKACRALDLRFLDLSTPSMNKRPLLWQKESLEEAINKRSADIIAPLAASKRQADTSHCQTFRGVFGIVGTSP